MSLVFLPESETPFLGGVSGSQPVASARINRRPTHFQPVVMQLEHDTTRLGCEGSVGPRRPTGVRARSSPPWPLASLPTTRSPSTGTPLPNGLPKGSVENAPGEILSKRLIAGFIGFIQIAGQHFLVHAVGIPWGCFPIVIHFDGHEFNVWLAFWHVNPRRNTPDAAPGCKLNILLHESRTTGDDEPC